MVQGRREADEGGAGVWGEGRRRKLVLGDLQKGGRQAQETFHVQDGGAGGCSCSRNVSCKRKERSKRCFLFTFTFNMLNTVYALVYLTVPNKPGIVKVLKNAA